MERHHLPCCFGMASLPRCSSTRADSQGALQASRSCETVCPQRAHPGKTSASSAPAPPTQAPAWPADVQQEAEEHQPDPAVDNHSPVSWAQEAGTQESQTY